MLVQKLLGAAPSVVSSFEGFIGISSSVRMDTSSCASSESAYYVVGFESLATRAGFLIKLDKNGSAVWQRKLTSATGVTVYDVFVTPSEDIYVTLTNANPTVVTLLKYNSNGTLQWQRKISHATNLSLPFFGKSITADSSGNVYCFIHTSETGQSSYVLKYNSSGALQWQKRFYYSTVNYTPASITTDGSNIYCLVVDGSPTNNTVTIRKLDSSGNLATSKVLFGFNQFSDILYDGTNLLVVGGSGSVFRAVKYNTSLVYQGARQISNSNFVSSVAGLVGNNFVAGNVSTRYYTTGTFTPSILTKRLINSSFGGGALSKFGNDANLITGTGNMYLSSASRFDGYLMAVSPTDDVGMYTPMSITNNTTADAAGTEPSSFTSNMLVTDGTATDAAGDITDASTSYTITLYPKV